jgi:Icc-related predicted phosphoesterase
LKFVAISDTHGKHTRLKLPKGDVLLHAGDISFKGRKSEVVDFLQWFSAQPFRHKIFIAGNHDFYFEKESPLEVKKLIPEQVIYLNDSETEVDGIKIWGSPVTPWFHNWAFNRKRGAQIRAHWNKIPENTDIIMTHGPVYGVLDLTKEETHTGCVDLLHTLETIKPKVHLCGHIHEGYGNVKRKGISFINASMVNESYELLNAPISFTL